MNYAQISLDEKLAALEQLRLAEAGAASRGWLPSGSGSLSCRIGPYVPNRFYFAVSTAVDGSELRAEGAYLFMDAAGRTCESTTMKPSHEAAIHAKIYRLTGCGAILHGHTVLSHWLGKHYMKNGMVPLPESGLKSSLGIWDPSPELSVPIIPMIANSSSMSEIAAMLSSRLNHDLPCLLLQGQGIYVWGSSPSEVNRHLETIEFLFELQYRTLLMERE